MVVGSRGASTCFINEEEEDDDDNELLVDDDRDRKYTDESVSSSTFLLDRCAEKEEAELSLKSESRCVRSRKNI